jgi:hypothetical protein
MIKESILIYTSIFSRFIRLAQKNPKSVNFIRQIKPLTFGTRLMLNCLKTRQEIDLFEFLGTYIADFKKLTPQQQKAFIHNIQIIINDLDLVSIEP